MTIRNTAFGANPHATDARANHTMPIV